MKIHFWNFLSGKINFPMKNEIWRKKNKIENPKSNVENLALKKFFKLNFKGFMKQLNKIRALVCLDNFR